MLEHSRPKVWGGSKICVCVKRTEGKDPEVLNPLFSGFDTVESIVDVRAFLLRRNLFDRRVELSKKS